MEAPAVVDRKAIYVFSPHAFVNVCFVCRKRAFHYIHKRFRIKILDYLEPTFALRVCVCLCVPSSRDLAIFLFSNTPTCSSFYFNVHFLSGCIFYFHFMVCILS